MKIKITLFCASLVAAFVFWASSQKQESTIPASATLTAGAKQIGTNITTNTNKKAAPNNLPPAKSTATEHHFDYIQKIKADPQYDWKQPINFWGRVVDESNNIVANASVHFVWNDISEKGTSEADTKSDGNGFFSLIDHKGKRLYVDVSKEGYYSSGDSRGATFEYANPYDGLFKPDSMNPVVFHLRKKGVGADLVSNQKFLGSRVDGTVSYVDLTTGKNSRTPPGDLTIRFTRGERNADKKFDWTFTLGVVGGGGLIESTDEFMFLAPEDGYQPTFEISHKVGDVDWVDQEKHKFYVKSQDGQHYARIEITIYAYYQNNAAYLLNWALNPNGSRNLESK